MSLDCFVSHFFDFILSTIPSYSPFQISDKLFLYSKFDELSYFHGHEARNALKTAGEVASRSILHDANFMEYLSFIFLAQLWIVV